MTETKYPKAFYAAAGVGDLVYQQLLKLPVLAEKLQDKASELRREATTQAPAWKQKATEFGANATSKAAEFTAKVDPAKVRDTVVSGTQTVAEKATKFYENLASRGEKAFTEAPAETPAAAPKAAATPAAPKAPAASAAPKAKPAAPKAAATEAPAAAPKAEAPAAPKAPAAKGRPTAK